MKFRFAAIAASILVVSISGLAIAEGTATLRGGTPIPEEAAAPAFGKVENKDLRRTRNYPEQPPTIPHKVRDYEVTKNANKCMSCHSRRQTGESQAPMVSVTHFMDRDYQVLATISPRRYFCNQCHVVQQDVKAPVVNEFKDVEDVLKSEASKK